MFLYSLKDHEVAWVVWGQKHLSNHTDIPIKQQYYGYDFKMVLYFTYVYVFHIFYMSAVLKEQLQGVISCDWLYCVHPSSSIVFDWPCHVTDGTSMIWWTIVRFNTFKKYIIIILNWIPLTNETLCQATTEKCQRSVSGTFILIRDEWQSETNDKRATEWAMVSFIQLCSSVCLYRLTAGEPGSFFVPAVCCLYEGFSTPVDLLMYSALWGISSGDNIISPASFSVHF